MENQIKKILMSSGIDSIHHYEIVLQYKDEVNRNVENRVIRGVKYKSDSILIFKEKF